MPACPTARCSTRSSTATPARCRRPAAARRRLRRGRGPRLDRLGARGRREVAAAWRRPATARRDAAGDGPRPRRPPGPTRTTDSRSARSATGAAPDQRSRLRVRLAHLPPLGADCRGTGGVPRRPRRRAGPRCWLGRRRRLRRHLVATLPEERGQGSRAACCTRARRGPRARPARPRACRRPSSAIPVYERLGYATSARLEMWERREEPERVRGMPAVPRRAVQRRGDRRGDRGAHRAGSAFARRSAVVAGRAPKLQRVLAEALEAGGWFGEAHEGELRKAAPRPTRRSG